MAPSLISGGDDEPARPERVFVAELQEHHHGRRVRIESATENYPWAVEGNLWLVSRETEQTEMRLFNGEPMRTRNTTTTTIQVGPARFEVEGTEEVTFL
jgi:hypothetical protein